MSSVISFAYFTCFSKLNISGTNANICKWQTVFLFFLELYVIHLKNQGVKIRSWYHFNRTLVKVWENLKKLWKLVITEHFSFSFNFQSAHTVHVFYYITKTWRRKITSGCTRGALLHSVIFYASKIHCTLVSEKTNIIFHLFTLRRTIDCTGNFV